MKQFDYIKFVNKNPLLKEGLDNQDEEASSDQPITIELDMAWDDDDAAHAAFQKYNIDVQGTDGRPGTYEVTGKKENILAYLKSPYYDMDDETIEQYYPELLSGEMEETDGYGSYKNPETLLEFDGQDDFYINVSVRDAKKALEILRDEFSSEIRNKTIQLDGSDSYVINDREVAMDLFDALKLQGVEIIDTDVEAQDSDWDDDDEDLEETKDQPLGPDEELMEANVPDNIKRFAKKKGVSALVNKLAGWAEKAGKRIVGGTAIGKNYDTLILDLTHNGGEIRIDTVEDNIEVNDYPVNNYASFLNALNNSQDSEDSIEEGWPSSYPRAEFSDAVHKALQAGLDKEELHRIVNFG